MISLLYVTAARLPTGLPKLAKGEINKFDIFGILSTSGAVLLEAV
jgi:hypothetical protein